MRPVRRQGEQPTEDTAGGVFFFSPGAHPEVPLAPVQSLAGAIAIQSFPLCAPAVGSGITPPVWKCMW